MTVKNIQANALETHLSLHAFGKEMKQLNLNGVPKERRSAAIMDHLMKIIANSVHNKEKAQEIHISRLLHQHKHG